MRIGGDMVKRDMDLVRKILQDLSEGKCLTHNFLTNQEEHNIYFYHLKIMRQAGFIDFRERGYKGGIHLLETPELTWNGNDFLDAINNETIWNKTKQKLKDQGLKINEVGFSIVKGIATKIISQQLGLV